MFLLGLPLPAIAAWVIGFLLALTVHEAAHAFSAVYLGDPTPRHAGRTSFDPRAHLDTFGTLMLVLAGFGWGKPVPINPGNFRSPRIGNVLTSLAGPFANLAMALLLAIPFNLLPPESLLAGFLGIAMKVNLVLMVFNLLPIPPLDGGHALAEFLPAAWREEFLRSGPVVLFLVIAFDFSFHVGILSRFVWPAVEIVWAGVNLATRFGG